MPDIENQIYLGDGLYAEAKTAVDFMLYASNGVNVSDEVFLDYTMIQKLVTWATEIKERCS